MYFETVRGFSRLSRFIQEVKSTLGSSLAHLNLNIYEFAAFKALCIWKLRFYETSFAQKIIAHEHYEGVTGALRNYYEVGIKHQKLC